MLHRGYRQRVRTVPHPPTRYPDNPSDMSGLGLGLFSVADAARDARLDLAQPESNTVSTRKMIRATPRVGSGPKPVAPAAVRPLSGMVASFRDTSIAFVADVEKLSPPPRPPLTPRTLPQLSQRGRRPEGLPLPRSQRERMRRADLGVRAVLHRGGLLLRVRQEPRQVAQARRLLRGRRQRQRLGSRGRSHQGVLLRRLVHGLLGRG